MGRHFTTVGSIFPLPQSITFLNQQIKVKTFTSTRISNALKAEVPQLGLERDTQSTLRHLPVDAYYVILQLL